MNERHLRVRRLRSGHASALFLAGFLGSSWVEAEPRPTNTSLPNPEAPPPSVAPEVGAPGPTPETTVPEAPRFQATSGSEERARRSIDAHHAVRLALRNSPALNAAQVSTSQAKVEALGEEGRYQMVFQADAQYNVNTTPRLQAGDIVNANGTRQFVIGAQVTRNYAFGTTAVFRVQGERYDYSFQFINPTISQTGGFGATSRLTLTQPLLRGFGSDVGLVELHAAEANRTYAEKYEARTASGLVRDVLVAYWELWYASEAVEIQRQSLDLANHQKTDADARVSRGALAPADALTFETQVAQLEESLVEAESNERSRAIELLRLTGAERTAEGNVSWAALAPPEDLDTPTRSEIERSVEDNSVELSELEAQVKVAEVRAHVAGDALRPRLDVDGYVEARGVGTEISSTVDRFGALSYVSGHVGVTYELPTDNTQKNADRQSALLAISSAKANLEVARDKISSQAALGVASAEAAERRLKLARRTREVAQKTLQAAQGRYNLGLAIPMQVQEADDDLRQARLREARARVDLATQQTILQHLSGVLLHKYVEAH